MLGLLGPAVPRRWSYDDHRVAGASLASNSVAFAAAIASSLVALVGTLLSLIRAVLTAIINFAAAQSKAAIGMVGRGVNVLRSAIPI